MRFLDYLVNLFLFSIVFTLPIQNQGSEDGGIELKSRSNDEVDFQFIDDLIKKFSDEEYTDLLLERLAQDEPIHDLTKRDSVLLTQFFTQLNTSGVGITFVKYFATNPLSQPTTIDAIVGFLKSKSISTILTDLDSSNLAVDIINEVLSHYDAFGGLVTIVKALFAQGTISLKKRDEPVPVEKRGLIGDIFGAVNGLLFGGQPTSSATTPATSSTGTVGVVGQVTSVIGGAAGQATSVIGGAAGQATSVIGGAAGQATSVIGGAAGQATSVIGGAAGQATSVIGAIAGQATSAIVGAAGQTASGTTNSVSTAKTSSAATAQSTSSSGGLLGLVGGLLGGIFGTAQNVAQTVGGAVANATDDIIGGVTSTASDLLGVGANITNSLIGLSLPAGLDATEVAIFTQLLSFASSNNIEDFMVALDKSGFGSSVIYTSLTDSSMQTFVEKLAASIKSNQVYTLSEVWSALLSTGFLTNTFSKIYSSTQYLNTVTNFIKYILFNFYKFL